VFVKSEVTGRACIGLEQNIIDIIESSEWRKRLLACVRIVGQHTSIFTVGSWKMNNWMKCQPRCQKC